MLTPVDIQNKVFKGGIGFDKRDIEVFMSELSTDYAQLYRSNIELKDKVTTLNESLQHYRSIEDSLQKALTLSQKTSEETVNAANDKARQICMEAEIKAEAIVSDANLHLQELKEEINNLQQQYALFKKQYTQMLKTQLQIVNNDIVNIDLGPDYDTTEMLGGYNSFSGGYGLGSDNLGFSPSSAYSDNSYDNGRERTNQEPSIDRGSLNMDPFAAAMTGGRFSKPIGGNSKDNTNRKEQNNPNSTKSGLNIKRPSSGDTRVKRNFTNVNSNVVASAQNTDTNLQTITNANVGNDRLASKTKNNIISENTEATQQNNLQSTKTTTSSENRHTMAENTIKVGGEVETKTPKSNMLDSEDNYNSGFDFVEENTQENAGFTERDTNISSSEDTVIGEVVDKVNKSNMLDSEDNHDIGFDFVEENSFDGHANNSLEDAIVGEVEDKLNKANMLDSEDNHNIGFDFVSDNFDEGSTENITYNNDDDIYSGEVEDKVNESTMLDSEDNYSDDFDFVVSNDTEDEIPTILSFDSSSQNKDSNVLEGDVEDVAKKSNLIGNFDDNNEGFKFL